MYWISNSALYRTNNTGSFQNVNILQLTFSLKQDGCHAKKKERKKDITSERVSRIAAFIQV